ncbi:MAG: hypothetical protein FWH15_05910 [Betaproteobacteria bacterium]|nr:hypothetical protein [Betaproteobacteria bacterium]
MVMLFLACSEKLSQLSAPYWIPACAGMTNPCLHTARSSFPRRRESRMT